MSTGRRQRTGIGPLGELTVAAVAQIGGRRSRARAWRADLDPAEGRLSAPAGVKVHDGAGYVLFAGAALLPPGWLVRAARTGPGGLLVLAGPCAGTLVPGDLDDGTVEDMLGTADLIAARMPATLTRLPAQPASATARSGAG